jgi:hypothetical protein
MDGFGHLFIGKNNGKVVNTITKFNNKKILSLLFEYLTGIFDYTAYVSRVFGTSKNDNKIYFGPLSEIVYGKNIKMYF